MDFGKLPVEALDSINFALPPLVPANKEVLGGQARTTQFKFGCATWGRKNWVGKYYPADAKEKDYLGWYAKQFNTIEFNGLYYKLQTREQVVKWAAMVPDDFLFCPKFTQSITHYNRLRDTDAQVDAFLDSVFSFGGKLGPALLLPHPQMGPKQLDTLIHFIDSLPHNFSIFLELRHPDWFSGPMGFDQEMLGYLRAKKRGLVITDTAGRRDCLHQQLSAPECFIRFAGNGLHPTDYTRIDKWVQQLKIWMENGLETCYFMVHQPDDLHAPELITYMINELNRHCGTQLPTPKLFTQKAPPKVVAAELPFGPPML